MRVRTIFISDCHIGSPYCNYNSLLNILKEVDCENIYIVGDFIDGIALKNKFIWKKKYNNIITELLKNVNKGVKVCYIWGNHDDFMKDFDELTINKNIVIKRAEEYITLKNKKYIVLHGDIFDNKIIKNKCYNKLGGLIYNLSLIFNRFFKKFNISLNNILKNKIKQIVTYINKYQQSAIDYAKINKYDGIILGHIHYPNIFYKNNIHYVNTGDFIDSNTVVVEDFNGNIKLINLNNNKYE